MVGGQYTNKRRISDGRSFRRRHHLFQRYRRIHVSVGTVNAHA
ncbi:hypothetical protein JTE90_022850, partial [Oedothorax gibbosus]